MRRVGEEEVGEEDKNEPVWALSLCFVLVFGLLLTPGFHHGNEKRRANVSQCTLVSSAVSGTSLSNAIEQSSRMLVVTMSITVTICYLKTIDVILLQGTRVFLETNIVFQGTRIFRHTTQTLCRNLLVVDAVVVAVLAGGVVGCWCRV